MSAVAPETLMAAGYAVFLTAAALGLDLLARNSHRRAQTYRTAGFAYHSSIDAWECPEGERLHRVEVDPHLRLIRYRARAHVCNGCRLKEACTDSDEGRQISRAIDSWPHSEAGRFHRVIALVMVGLAFLVLAAGAALNHGAGDLFALGVALLVSAVAGLFLLSDFRETRSGFPWPEGQLSGDAPSVRPFEHSVHPTR
jgi:hypothetical protein